MVFENLNTALQTECLLDPTATILAGVSGGPDSLCMLEVLQRLGYPLVVAHLDHGLRPESQTEADAVGKIATKMGLPFLLGREDVAVFAEKHDLSLEEAGRTVRYRFLFQQAALCQAQVVAVGHTADDQVETVLMHLLRGAGLAGLRGMAYRSLPNPWSQEIPLVRPLLGVWREQILEYIQEHNLQPTFDASNLDTRFYRNRLRHELLPYLEGYNPQVRQRLWRMAQVLRTDYAVLEEITASAWQASLQVLGDGYVAFDCLALKNQPLSIQRYLMVRALHHLRPGLRDINFDAIECVLNFLQVPTRRAQVNLFAGLRAFIEGEQFWLAAWEADLSGGCPQLSGKEEYHLEVPGQIRLASGWLLRVEIIADSPHECEQSLTNEDPYQAWLDLERLSMPLVVRTRRPGDHFRPLGMDGHSIKLSDFFINMKLPRRARGGWPLVLSGQEIAWAPGFRLGHAFRITGETNQMAHLILERAQRVD